MESKRMKVAVYQKAKENNHISGDSHYFIEEDDQFLAVVADGLGSGEVAQDSSRAVIDVIKENPELGNIALIRALNQALVGKRGVVLGMLRVDFAAKQYHYSSIGNIGLMTIQNQTLKKRNIPISGYLGVYPRGMKEVSDKLEEGMVFAMFSDGVNSRELSHALFESNDVEDIIDQFDSLMAFDRDDDTTLVMMKYEGS